MMQGLKAFDQIERPMMGQSVPNPIAALIAKLVQSGMGQAPQVGTPGINPGAPDPRQSIPFPANIMAGTMTNNIPQILTGQGQIPEWQNQRQDMMRQAYQPVNIKQRSPVSGRDLLPVGIAALIASLFGAKDEDLTQGLQGFVGARQDMVGQEYQQAMQNDQLRRQGIVQEAGFIGDKIDKAEKARSDNERFLREMGVLDKKAKIDAEADRRNAELKKKDPEEALYDDYLRTINGIKDPAMQMRGITLLRKARQGFGLTPDESTEFNQILASETLAREGKSLDNQKKAIELPWIDKNLQQAYDKGLKQLELAGLNVQIKEKDLLNYDENQRLKRVMWYALFNQRQQNIDFNQGMDIYNAQNKAQLEKVKQIDDMIAVERKKKEALIKSMTEQAKSLGMVVDEQALTAKIDAYIQVLEAKKKAANDALPAAPTAPPSGGGGFVPFDISGGGAALESGGMTLPPIADPKTGKEVGNTQRGAAGANQKVNTKKPEPKKAATKSTADAKKDPKKAMEEEMKAMGVKRGK